MMSFLSVSRQLEEKLKRKSSTNLSPEFGLARFKSNHVKAMKGLEYALSRTQTDSPAHLHGDQGGTLEKHKPLPPQTTPTQKPSLSDLRSTEENMKQKIINIIDSVILL
ncbi:PRELI domain-containing protein 1, mitochondrial-like isoform X2 [Acanthopagrus latus]|uniref:PRELI domain-containing protein 1, mitochondrial-like isoform X2 n=1 Tax=Acanthopagrus latus TaxID=8177 RepID=UPI00187CD74E|nr:PRELI domain-containing protein 1, mitochondrial-like isoform X2 [Acanthopagrus latus]